MIQDKHGRIRVWMLQREIHHYRLPVWDEFLARFGDRYHLTVVGALNNGLPFGASETRDYIRELPSKKKDRSGVWNTVPRLLRDHRPDVLVCELSPRYALCWTLPTMCRMSGMSLVGWSKVFGTTEGFLRPAIIRLKRQLFRSYPSLLVYGQSSRDELLEYGIPSERIFVSRNTIDTRRIFIEGDKIAAEGRALRERHGLEGKRILLMVAQMVERKRHSDVLDAWETMRRNDPELRLVLVGGGSEIESIRARARAVDSSNIIVTGRVPEGEDYAWMAAADYNVQPGGVGLAINQSMALATPTLIADEPGPDAENIQHGVTGWRFRPGDPGDLARVLAEIQADPDQARQVALCARNLIRDAVNIEHMVGAMAESIEYARTRTKRENAKQ